MVRNQHGRTSLLPGNGTNPLYSGKCPDVLISGHAVIAKYRYFAGYLGIIAIITLISGHNDAHHL